MSKQKINRCKAFVTATNTQCKNRAIRGTNYCWVHYPKKQLFISVIFSALISLVLTTLFIEPISYALSKFTWLNYLDNRDPVIWAITPDLQTMIYIDKNTKSFGVRCSDNESGLDVGECEINLFIDDVDSLKSIKGKLTVYNDSINFDLDEELEYGHYNLYITVTDKAGNICKANYTFSVVEQVDLKSSVHYSRITELDIKRKFPTFYEKRSDSFGESYDYLIYTLYLSNRSGNLWFNDLYLTLNVERPIFGFVEAGSWEAKYLESYNIAEETNKLIPKNHVYSSTRYIEIKEIAPGGWLKFIILVGFSKEFNRELFSSEDFILPNKSLERISLYGRYVSKGYDKSENKRILLELKAKFVE